MNKLFIFLLPIFLFISSAYPNDNSTKWSDWMPLQDTGISWRFHCDKEPMKGKYRAYFEFARSDMQSKRTGDRTYAHVRLDFEGNSTPAIASFYTDNKKDWRLMPFPLVRSNLNFISRVVYSRDSKQPDEWSN